MRIVIDARMYGLENSGIGRYTMNLINELEKTDSQNQYIILLRKRYYDTKILRSNFKKILVDIPHYSLAEQLKLPGLIKKQKPDIVHFLHFNVPIFFNGKFIVTIHDMTMHSHVTNSATTLPMPIYAFKQLMYKLVFRHAVVASQKIIVPSSYVKKEIVDYFRIPEKKVEVIYEGY